MLRIFAYLSMIALLSPLVAMAQAAPPAQPVEAAPAYPRPSLEAPRPRLGDPDQVFISSGANLHFAKSWWSDDHSGETAWRLRPALDLFVLKNFSVGGALTFGHSAWKSQTTVSVAPVGANSASVGAVDLSTMTSSWTLQLAPRAGYNLAIEDWLSLYSRAGILFGMELVEFASAGHDSSRYLGATLDVALMFHVAAHFEIGFGPNLYVDLTRAHARAQNVIAPEGKQVALGVDMLVGGWF